MMIQARVPYIYLFSFFIVFALLTPSICDSTIFPKRKVRGMFVFGSSLVDNGNNNFLENTIARVDYLPYGIDFPLGPTGRFTNGKNVIDVLGEKLWLPKYLPPFNDPSTTGRRILHGVDFASGSSGILDTTGVLARNVTTFTQQIINFKNSTLPALERQLRKKGAELLSEYLFVVGVGGNDYTRNYFAFDYNVTVEEFTNNLTATLADRLKTLYSLGARKFVLMSVYPIGCYPMSQPPPGELCVEKYNSAAELYNANLIKMVDSLPAKLPASKFVFVNAYGIIFDILKNPSSQGFTNINTSCCEVGITGSLCKRGGKVCSNRNKYLYFDGLHPTQALNLILGTKAFSSNLQSEVYPYNIQKLSKMSSSTLQSEAYLNDMETLLEL